MAKPADLDASLFIRLQSLLDQLVEARLFQDRLIEELQEELKILRESQNETSK